MSTSPREMITAAAVIVPAMLAGLFARSKVRADALHTMGDTWSDSLAGQRASYDMRLKLMDDTIREQALRIDQLAAEVASLRTENLQLVSAGLRFRRIPDARPMGEFCDNGWLRSLNATVAHPLGVHVRIYVDDIDGWSALGWQLVPLEDVPETTMWDTHTTAIKAEMIRTEAEQARGAAGYDATYQP